MPWLLYRFNRSVIGAPAALDPFGAERNLMSLLEFETRLVCYSMARKSEIRKVLIPSLQLGRIVLHLSVCCVSLTRHINIVCVCVCVCKMRNLLILEQVVHIVTTVL